MVAGKNNIGRLLSSNFILHITSGNNANVQSLEKGLCPLATNTHNTGESYSHFFCAFCPDVGEKAPALRSKSELGGTALLPWHMQTDPPFIMHGLGQGQRILCPGIILVQKQTLDDALELPWSYESPAMTGTVS